ncbi:MAG: GIY-YIG nuclease family protein [Candidatus Pacebacteria bacterium]|nr:GIY-YIG nuclease family protein [Candidatus Paceibacterota bacterium]
MSFFAYILKCADGTFYVGSTNDLSKRIHKHNHLKGGAHYTKIRRPVELRYFETCATYSEVRAREGALKRLTRSEKIKLVSKKAIDPAIAGDRTPLKNGVSKSLKMCKKYLGRKVSIVIDQAYGTYHGNIRYTSNYGFVPKTKAPDGMELDAYMLGPKKPLKKVSGHCIAIIHRLEDDDDKLILVENGVEMTDKQIEKAVHFQERFFKHTIIRE